MWLLERFSARLVISVGMTVASKTCQWFQILVICHRHAPVPVPSVGRTTSRSQDQGAHIIFQQERKPSSLDGGRSQNNIQLCRLLQQSLSLLGLPWWPVVPGGAHDKVAPAPESWLHACRTGGVHGVAVVVAAVAAQCRDSSVDGEHMRFLPYGARAP
mmetsp:Transcript_68204/g.177067  ORF Transcript_68204/g.177067 Transcript_68204/m.177067 type:complete len:158 (-) Transcript_68204:161-634(-)